MTPFFSVVTPAYNAAPYIAATLESAFAQTFTDFEVVVVNDGSPDTPELERALTPFRTRIRYLVQENRGAAGARNTAIREARGRYLAFLDADDWWEPGCLAAHRRELEARPELDVLYGDGVFFGDSPLDGKRMMDVMPSVPEVSFENLIAGHAIVFEPAAVAKRETVVQVGLFDESLASAEDLDLWLRIVRAGGRIAWHKTQVLRYRRRGDSLSADSVSLGANLLRVLNKHRTSDLTPTRDALFAKRIQEVEADLAWAKGERALEQRNASLAADEWAQANRYRKKPAVSVAVFLLRFAPGLFFALKQARAGLRR